jgi:hypothetical protein
MIIRMYIHQVTKECVMKRIVTIGMICLFLTICAGSVGAADYVSATFPSGPLLRALYGDAAQVAVSQVQYVGKVKDPINSSLYYVYVVAKSGKWQGITTVIPIIKTDANYWYYDFTIGRGDSVSGPFYGLLQTAY